MYYLSTSRQKKPNCVLSFAGRTKVDQDMFVPHLSACSLVPEWAQHCFETVAELYKHLMANTCFKMCDYPSQGSAE